MVAERTWETMINREAWAEEDRRFKWYLRTVVVCCFAAAVLALFFGGVL